jgi:ATP-dependent DNA ligase
MANKPPRQVAGFIETMDCLPVSKLPEGPEWTYEIKLDGYRPEAVRSGRRTTFSIHTSAGQVRMRAHFDQYV